MKKEFKIFKKGENFNFQIVDEIEMFEITDVVPNENGYIYALVSKKKDIIYKNHNQLIAHNELKLFLKETCLTNEKQKIYDAEVIKQCIVADLTKNATVKEIARWIWIRGYQAHKELDFVKDIRLVNAKVSVSFNALDTIDASACIYRNCRAELPALNELKDWHELCKIADAIRNPLLPTLLQYHILFKNNGLLGEKYVSAAFFSLYEFIQLLKIHEEDILAITQWVANKGNVIVYPNV